jgi:NifU-like protein involved in Fe-S cluster formation
MDYSAEVLRRFADLPGAGPLPQGPGLRVEGGAGTEEEGIRVVFAARVEAGRLVAVAFRAFGCPHTLAVCSMAAERLADRPVRELGRLDPLELGRELGVPAAKSSRLLVIQDALRNCLADWDNRRLVLPPQSD